VAELPTVGDFRKFEEGRCSAIGVEDLGAVEFAIAVDGGEGPVVTELVFGSQIEIVDFAVEP